MQETEELPLTVFFLFSMFLGSMVPSLLCFQGSMLLGIGMSLFYCFRLCLHCSFNEEEKTIRNSINDDSIEDTTTTTTTITNQKTYSAFVNCSNLSKSLLFSSAFSALDIFLWLLNFFVILPIC